MKNLFIILFSAVFAFADTIKTDAPLIITIQGVPQVDAADFNNTYSVYSNGTIRIPYIGDVRAAGKTPDQLARHIESLYKSSEIYTNPTVNITYTQDDEVDKKMFTFRSQGGSRVVPYQRDMTLQVAIAAAGGAGTFDSKKYATLERNGKEYKYDLTEINHRNVKIYPKDVIKLPHINDDSVIIRGVKKIFGGGE